MWEHVNGLWRPIYGGFDEHGVSIEWHEFRLDRDLAWSKSFHPRSLELCLNYTGEAELLKPGRPLHVTAEEFVAYTPRENDLTATRLAANFHRFFTIELSPEFLMRQFAMVLGGLRPDVLRFLDNPEKLEPWAFHHALPMDLLTVRRQLLNPPVAKAALDVWFNGKLLEILAQTLFQADKPTELFCSRHKRINIERVLSAEYVLERDLANPPSLEMLAAEVDCSPFYLSRLFTEHLGSSIPKYLRIKRIETAADLILTQGKSVTEAAMAVGYSSLSAFNKAFAAHFRTTPGDYGKGRRKR